MTAGDVQPAEPPSRVAPDGGMLLLGGVGSGGTDLLWNVVNAHREIFIVGEVPFLPAIAERFPAAVPPSDVEAVVAELRRLDEYQTLAHHHWDNFRTGTQEERELGPPPEPIDGAVSLGRIYRWVVGAPDSVRWVGNKTPTNTENIDRLARAFPDARFIIIVRDPRDVVLSWRRRWGRDELMTADKWERRLARGREHVAALPQESVLVVRYEQLLDDLEGTSRRVCAFLGLDFDPEMLRFHEHVTVQISGQVNRGRPIVAGNYGKWRTDLPPRLVRRVEEIAWDGLREYGYDVTQARGPRPLTAAERARGRARDVWAVLRDAGETPRGDDRRRTRRMRLVLQAKKYLFRRDITT